MILAQPEYTNRVDVAVTPAYQPDQKPVQKNTGEPSGPRFEDHLNAAKEQSEKQASAAQDAKNASKSNDAAAQDAAATGRTSAEQPKKIKKNDDSANQAQQMPRTEKNPTEKQLPASDAEKAEVLFFKQKEKPLAGQNALKHKKHNSVEQQLTDRISLKNDKNSFTSDEKKSAEIGNENLEDSPIEGNLKNLKADDVQQSQAAAFVPDNQPGWVENAAVSEQSGNTKERSEINSDKKKAKNELNLEVRDLRTDNNKLSDSKTVQRLDEARQADSGSQNSASFESHLSEQSVNQNVKIDGNSAEMELSRGRAGEMSAKDMAQELKENKNADIARTAKIMLKNDGVGEIRLILKPEKLGSVRIKLEMKENVLAGRIIVDNIQVKEIFEDNLKSLQQALQEQGFDTSGLEVSVGGREGQHQQNHEQEMSDQQRQAAVEELANSVPSVDNAFGHGSTVGGINIVA